MALLEIKDLVVNYGVIKALKGISFEVNKGEVVALIGANGSGKTTVLQTISGMHSPTSGSIILDGTDITKIPSHKIVTMGMAHVPEGRRVFAQLSVLDNLKMGAYTRKDTLEIENNLKSVYESFPRLKEREKHYSGNTCRFSQRYKPKHKQMGTRRSLSRHHLSARYCIFFRNER